MTDWSKIGRRSRNKGGQYERKIVKILTDLTHVVFRRAPRSGALLRGGRVNGLFVSGDLISEKEFCFSIECKNRKKITIESVIKNQHTSELMEGWFQCVYDARIANKLPIMFFYLVNSKSDFVCVCDDGLKALKYVGTVMSIRNLKNPFKFVIDQKEAVQDLPELNIISIAQFSSTPDFKHCFKDLEQQPTPNIPADNTQ